jgi:hypothetical protein
VFVTDGHLHPSVILVVKNNTFEDNVSDRECETIAYPCKNVFSTGPQGWRHDTQPNDIQHNNKNMTLIITLNGVLSC